MRKRGIKSNDIVTICSHNHLNTIVPLYASFFLGAIPASIESKLPLTDVILLIKQVKPKIFFVSVETEKLIRRAVKELGLVAEIVVFGDVEGYPRFSSFLERKDGEDEFMPLKEVDDMDTAIILFSSGTTSIPKGICLSHYSILNNFEHYRLVCCFIGFLCN